MIADEDLKPVGIVTDPDTRRAFLKGETLDATVSSIMNRVPKTLPPSSSKAERLALMHRYQIGQMPLVDSSGRVCGLSHEADEIATQGHANAAVIMAGGEGRRLRPPHRKYPQTHVTRYVVAQS